MAVLNPQIIAEVMRQRLNLPDGAKAPRYINGIPEALKKTARKIAANPKLRPLIITDRATTTIALAAGKVNLQTGYSTHRFLLEYFDKGKIYHSSFAFPLRQIPMAAKDYVQQFTDYGYYYIDGDFLYAQNAAKTALTGSLSFAVPQWPSTLAQLPDSEEVQTIFFDKLYEWCLSDQAPGNDAAEDGEK